MRNLLNAEEIVKEAFNRDAPLTDTDIEDLATDRRWLDDDFVDLRRKFLERLQKKGYTREAAEMALRHADEYTKGISVVLSEKAPELLEETVKSIYPEALKISEEWIKEYIRGMFR